MTNRWWRTPRRVIQPILTLADGGVDAARMVEELHGFGCNTILQNVGGMVAWYPTRIAHHVPPEGMRGDVLGTVIRSARERDMRVLGRFDFSGLREGAYQARPGWFYIGRDGKPMADKGFYATCLSGPYLEEYVLPLIDEVAAGYALDGAFINMFGHRVQDRRGVFHGPCHCAACRERYFAATGRDLPAELPAGHPDTARYFAFTRGMFQETLQRLDGVFKERYADFAMLNGHASANPALLLEGGDTTEVELHWVVANPKRIADGPSVNWRYTAASTCRQVRTMGDRYASIVNFFTCGGGRLAGHSEGWPSVGIAQVLANGGWPFIAFTGQPWAHDRSHEGNAKRLYSFMAGHDALFSGLRSTARIALVNPADHQDAAFRGYYGTLVKAHHEFDVIDPAQLVQEGGEALLGRYALVILPGVRRMPEGAAEAVAAYARRGGQVLASGRSALDAEILGIEKIEAVKPYVENAFFLNDFSEEIRTSAISVNGEMVYVRPAADAETYLPMTGEIEYASPELELLQPKNGQYGLIRSRHGMYMPWEIGKLIYTYGLQAHVEILERAIDLLIAGERPFVTDAPAQAEITLHRQESGRLILQMVNESGQDGIEFREPIAIRDIRVGVRAPEGAKVVAHYEGERPLEARMEDGYLTFTLPELRLYELVTVEEAE